MLKVNVVSTKNLSSLKIGDNGELYAHVLPLPPSDITSNVLPLSETLKLNGTGTSSMVINGAVTNQDFYLEASKEYEIYINTISIVIADAGAVLNRFGALTALTNGLEFYYWNQQNGKYSIVSGIKTNFEMLRAGCFEPAFGTANDAFLASNVSGASEAYCINIDMEDVFGLQWGLRLRKNSTDRIGFIIKDDITGLDFMDVRVFGLRV